MLASAFPARNLIQRFRDLAHIAIRCQYNVFMPEHNSKAPCRCHLAAVIGPDENRRWWVMFFNFRLSFDSPGYLAFAAGLPPYRGGLAFAAWRLGMCGGCGHCLRSLVLLLVILRWQYGNSSGSASG